MGELGERLAVFMRELDGDTERRSESSVFHALQMLNRDGPDASDEDRLAFDAESMAFLATHHTTNTGGASDPYYEGPDLGLITPEVLTHWATRADSAARPFLRSRYADLVWDLSKRASALTPDVRFARVAVDATLDLIEQHDYAHAVEGIAKLKRALSLALQISDRERVVAVTAAMILFEDAIADDAMPGLWGFSLDTLVGNKKIPLSVDQREKLVVDMEARLQRICEASGTSPDPHAAHAAAEHLLHYYRREGRHEDGRRVLRLMGKAYVAAAKAASPLVGSAWLRELFDTYHAEGMVDDADALAPLMAELGARASEEMQAHSVQISIPSEEIEQYVQALTEGPLEEVLGRVAWNFVPDQEEITTRVKQAASQFPFQALVPHALTDHEGRVKATVGATESDLRGRVVWQMSQDLSFMIPFLRLAIERVFARLAPSREDILGYLYQSPLFIPESRAILSAGLDACISGNHISAAHILAPQVEAALRNMLQLAGGGLYKPHRAGGQQLKNLSDVLDDTRVQERLGGTVVAYLSCLLADPRGWNLRNEVSHGMLPADSFGPGITDRLFHVMLLLGQLRAKPNADTSDEHRHGGNRQVACASPAGKNSISARPNPGGQPQAKTDARR